MGDKVRDARQPGHWWADNELIDVYGPIVGAYGIAVYAVLCRYADNKTGEAFPAIRKIAELLAISRPTVTKALKALEGAKLIRTKRRYIRGSKERDNNIYVLLNVPKVVNDVYHVVKEIDDGGKGDLPQVVNDVASKKTQLKKTKEKDYGVTDAPAQTEQPDTPPLTESVAVAVEQSTRPRDLLFDAITEHWQAAPGQVAILKSVMLGTNRKYPACNFSPPATPDEVGAFVHWYARKYPNINLPVAPEKLQSHFYQFRAAAPAARAETRIHNGMIQKRVGNSWYNERPAPNGAA